MFSKRHVARMFIVLLMVIPSFLAMTEGQKTVVLVPDHASVCGSDLQTMQQAFADVDLKPDYGGPHANGITHMAALGFDDGSYLELIAPQKPGAVEGTPWSKFMAADAGPCAWAVFTPDIKLEAERLKGLGIPASAPEPGSRKRPDGMSIEWTIANIGSGTPGSGLPFLIEDRTPHEWRVQTSASVKDSGLRGVDKVVLAVRDLNASIAMFRRVYGWSEPLIEDHRDFEAKLADFPGEPVMLATPLGGRSWLVDRLQKLGESPVAYLLWTKDFTTVAKRYRLSGSKPWFGQRLGWFDEKKLHGVKLGVLGQ